MLHSMAVIPSSLTVYKLSAFHAFIFHISFCGPVPLSLQNVFEALFKGVTKMGSIGNVWGSVPEHPYFTMRFAEQPLFPNCFQGQSYFCADTGGPLSSALTTAFGMSTECFWAAVSLEA